MESILRGMINEPVSKYDTNFADTLQNHLFESRLSDGSVIAIDLAATNINRGRDHGIFTNIFIYIYIYIEFIWPG